MHSQEKVNEVKPVRRCSVPYDVVVARHRHPPRCAQSLVRHGHSVASILFEDNQTERGGRGGREEEGERERGRREGEEGREGGREIEREG